MMRNMRTTVTFDTGTERSLRSAMRGRNPIFEAGRN